VIRSGGSNTELDPDIGFADVPAISEHRSSSPTRRPLVIGLGVQLEACLAHLVVGGIADLEDPGPRAMPTPAKDLPTRRVVNVLQIAPGQDL